MLPKLHRRNHPDADVSAWEVADAHLLVWRIGRRRWVVRGMSSAAKQWLSRQQLLEADFDTRRDATVALAAVMALEPPPRTSPVGCQLRRVRRGEHVSGDGRWKAIRAADGYWDLYRHTDKLPYRRRTLLAVARTFDMLAYIDGIRRQAADTAEPPQPTTPQWITASAKD